MLKNLTNVGDAVLLEGAVAARIQRPFRGLRTARPVAFHADLSKREAARRDTVAGDCWPAGILQLTFFQLNVHGGGDVQQAPYIQDRAANLAERPQRLP